MSEGRKDDKQKDRWDLLPYESVGQIVKVLTHGATKYTTIETNPNSVLYLMVEELEKCLNVNTVTSLYTHLGCVAHTTRKILDNETLNMLKDSGKIAVSGDQTIEITSPQLGNEERMTPHYELEMQEQSKGQDIDQSDLPKKPASYYYWYRETSAEYVDGIWESWPYILTMTIQQGLHAGTFVVGATTVWECLESLRKACFEHLPISRAPRLVKLQIQPRRSQAIVTGDRNWEQGILFSRCFAALQRHLTAWWLGDEIDSETGINHLAHAGCELFFLLTFVLRGQTAYDDRPSTHYRVRTRT